MGKRRFKRGKVPMKVLGRRYDFTLSANWRCVKDAEDKRVLVCASRSVTAVYQKLCDDFHADWMQYRSLEGLAREAYELILTAYRSSRERSLVGRALKNAVRVARKQFYMIWPETDESTQAFEEAARHWRLVTQDVVRSWQTKSDGYKLK